MGEGIKHLVDAHDFKNVFHPMVEFHVQRNKVVYM